MAQGAQGRSRAQHASYHEITRLAGLLSLASPSPHSWDSHTDTCLDDVATLLEAEVAAAVEEQFGRFPRAAAHFRWGGAVAGITPGWSAGGARRIPAKAPSAQFPPHQRSHIAPAGRRSQLMELYREVLDTARRQL